MNASISMLLEFVDSLVEWNGSAPVMFFLACWSEKKSTEYLVFFTSTDTMDVCVSARTLLYVKQKNMKPSIKLDNLSAFCSRSKLWDGF